MKLKSLRFVLGVLVAGLTCFAFLGLAPVSAQGGPEGVTPGIDKQSQSEYMSLLRNNQVTGKLDPADVLKARQQAQDLRHGKSGSSLGLTFSELGPDNFAGRTRAILIDKQDPAKIFAGCVSGGIWKSTSGGSSWYKTTVDGSESKIINVTCMAQAPSGTIYAGTGEGFSQGGGKGTGGFVGTGIYKSSDGNNFTVIPSTVPSISNIDTVEWAYVNKVACDPSGKLYAATNKGIRVYNEAGDTWSNPVLDANNQPINLNASDIKIASDGFMVLSVDNKCYTSTDGITFVCRSTGESGKLPVSGVGRVELAIAPSNPDIVYASIAKSNGALFNIYRSNNRGENWYVIGPGGSPNFNVFGNQTTNLIYEGGIYHNAISVFPDNPDMILLGGNDMWKGTKIQETGYFAWTQVSSNLFPIYSIYYLPVDHHIYVFDPVDPNTCYIGCDGGFFVTFDRAATFQARNHQYNTAQAYSITPAADGTIMGGTQDDGTLYIDFQGNTPKAADQLYNGDGGWCAISAINPKVYIVSSPNCASVRSPDAGENFAGYYSTTNMGGVTGAYVTPLLLWESVNDPLTVDTVQVTARKPYQPGEQILVRSSNNNYPFYYTLPLGVSLDSGDVIWVKDRVQTKFFLGVNGGIFMTKKILNFATTPDWFRIVSFTGTTSTLAVSKDGNTLYAGTQDGLLFRIKNVSSWVGDTTNNLEFDTIHIFANRVITSIAVDPLDAGRIVVTLGNYGNNDYVYFCSNALAASPAFTSKQANLPKMPVYSSLIEMDHPDMVLLGTEEGLYSTDGISGTPVWAAENTGFDNVPVYMIRQQTGQQDDITIPMVNGTDTTYMTYPGIHNYGSIYFATHGRGFFRCNNFVGTDEPGTTPASASSLKLYPNPASNLMKVNFSLNRQSGVSVRVYDLFGKLVMSRELPQQPSGPQQLSIDCSNLSKGTYMLQVVTGSKVSSSKFIVM